MKLELAHELKQFDGQTATVVCQYSDMEKELPFASVVMVTQRTPNDALYHDILTAVEDDASQLPFTLKRIGDCEAPAIIAASIYAGHQYARELDTEVDIDQPLKHDRIDVGLTPEGKHLIEEI